MAKISYASFVTGLSGKSGNSVFFRSPSQAFGYLRSYAYPSLTPQNELRGKEFKNLCYQLAQVSPLAIADLKAYAAKFAKLPPVGGGSLAARANNHVAVWILAVWNIAKAEPDSIDVGTVTLNDLTSLFGFVSVAEVVRLGYLPAVDGYEDYSKPFKP